MKAKYFEITRDIFFSTIAFSFFLGGCGISKPDYVKYTPPTSSSNESSAECVAALQAFKDNMSAAISGTCATSSCHASTAIKDIKLVAGDDTINRKAMKAYTGSSPATLFNKISKVTPHSGGDQSAALPLAKITAWTDAESKCK